MPNYLTQAFSLMHSLDYKILAAFIAAFLSFVIGCFTLYFARRNHNEQIIEKRKEERRKEIYMKLNDFYGPFQQYLNTSKEFYKILIAGKPKEFRTLEYLLNSNKEFDNGDGTSSKVIFTETDKVILKQIIKIGENLERLIVEKAGLVDDPSLRFDYLLNPEATDVTLEKNGLLAIAKAHLQIIRLAHTGKLVGDERRFNNYVFPRELPVKIEQNIHKLQTELTSLRTK